VKDTIQFGVIEELEKKDYDVIFDDDGSAITKQIAKAGRECVSLAL